MGISLDAWANYSEANRQAKAEDTSAPEPRLVLADRKTWVSER